MPNVWPSDGVYSDFEGPKHQLYISTKDYPAGYACFTYKTEGTNFGEWYLPSFGELRLVEEQGKKGFSSVDLSGMYWTSTQVYYNGNRAVTVGEEGFRIKSNTYAKVRAAKEF